MSVASVLAEAEEAMRAGVIKRRGIVRPIDDSELPELPPGWRWTRLGEITRAVPHAIKRGPFGSAIRKDMFVPKGFKVYEQQHAISGDFSRGSYYITEAKFAELSAFELHPKEILVSCSGTIGKVAIVPPTIEPGIINQALLKLSLHESAMLNEYFLILFPAFFMQTDTLTNLQGTLRSTTNAAAPRAWASSRISHARLESQRCTSSDAANDRYPLTMHARSWKNAATKFARHPLIRGVGGGVDIRAPLVQCCARRLSGSANT